MTLTPAEMRLVGRLLDMAADAYANHGCNDFLWGDFPKEEREALVRRMEYDNNPDPERADEVEESVSMYARHENGPPDWWLMRYYSKLFGYKTLTIEQKENAILTADDDGNLSQDVLFAIGKDLIAAGMAEDCITLAGKWIRLLPEYRRIYVPIDIETATYEEMMKEYARLGMWSRVELVNRIALIREMKSGRTEKEALARIAARRERWGIL